MEEKQKFVCSYCGAEYDSAPARARCELKCDEKQKQKTERLRVQMLQMKKSKRQEEVHKAYQNFIDVATKYRDDYSELAPLETEINGIPLYKMFWW